MDKTSKQPLDLPMDIVHEILLGLPVKKLIRFKCVCKSWYSFISSPLFQQHHYLRHAQQSPLLPTARFDYDFTLHLSTYSNNAEILINEFSIRTPSYPLRRYGWEYDAIQFPIPIQSCRGLVCLARCAPEPIVICNPSTQDVQVLPPPPATGRYFCIGFGYAESTEEFKSVRFFQTDEFQICCEVFTLGTDEEWRKARNPPPFCVNPGHAPFLNGALHLLSVHYKDNSYIAALDIDTEEYRGIQIPLPHGLLRSDRLVLTELGGSLYLVCSDREWDGELTLWLLKDYENKEWMKRYTIPIHYGYWPEIPCLPLALMEDGSILLNVFCAEGVLSYNPKEKTATQKIRNYYDYLSVGFYVESFF